MSEHYWCSDYNMFDGVILGDLHYQYRNYISEKWLFQWQQQISTSWMSLLLEMKGLKSCSYF